VLVADSKQFELKSQGSRSGRGGFGAKMRLLWTPSGRRALWVGLGLQAFQQLCGINTVMYYRFVSDACRSELRHDTGVGCSPTILQMAGYTDTRLAIWMSVAVAGANAVMTIVSIPLMDRGEVRQGECGVVSSPALQSGAGRSCCGPFRVLRSRWWRWAPRFRSEHSVLPQWYWYVRRRQTWNNIP
jgi:hypothetical protein